MSVRDRLWPQALVVSRAGVSCEHRVGCFFSVRMRTWADVLLALSVMQAAAMDVEERWRNMPAFQKDAAKTPVPGLDSVREAATPQTKHSRGRIARPRTREQWTPTATGGTGGTTAGPGDREEVVDSDMAALEARGVAGIETLFPPPMPVFHEAGDAPSATDQVRGSSTCVAEAAIRRRLYARVLMCAPAARRLNA